MEVLLAPPKPTLPTLCQTQASKASLLVVPPAAKVLIAVASWRVAVLRVKYPKGTNGPVSRVHLGFHYLAYHFFLSTSVLHFLYKCYLASVTSSQSPQGLQAIIRRNPTSKAWTSGMNPITQRSNTPGQSNGAGSQTQSTSKASTNQELNPASKAANHERFLWLTATSLVSRSVGH